MACLNVHHMLVTFDVFHEEMFELNDSFTKNISPIFVTFDVSQEERSSLKVLDLSN